MENMNKIKRVIILDQNNNFLRNYVVNPAIGTNGSPIGGIFGYLKCLQKMLRDLQPTSIIAIWDGKGGSRRRKNINKDYKEGRKAPKLNRNIDTHTEQENNDNKIWQMSRLFQYLQHMPIAQFMFEDVEADDIISYVVQLEHLATYQKIIISSDKDFYQLLNKNTIIFRPVQDAFVTVRSMLEEMQIHPNNFAICKALVGDDSDNIKGIQGCGIPTVAKRFPFLKEARDYYISDIVDHCKRAVREEKIKIYQNILDNVEKLEQNYSMVSLAVPNFSVQSKQIIRYHIEHPSPELKIMTIRRMMVEDGFPSNYSFDEMFNMMKNIVIGSKIL